MRPEKSRHLAGSSTGELANKPSTRVWRPKCRREPACQGRTVLRTSPGFGLAQPGSGALRTTVPAETKKPDVVKDAGFCYSPQSGSYTGPIVLPAAMDRRLRVRLNSTQLSARDSDDAKFMPDSTPGVQLVHPDRNAGRPPSPGSSTTSPSPRAQHPPPGHNRRPAWATGCSDLPDLPGSLMPPR